MTPKVTVIEVFTISCLLFSCSGSMQNVGKVPQKETIEKSNSLADQRGITLKRKVTIARFTNETAYGKISFFKDDNGLGGKSDRLEKQAMDILFSKLAATDKFILLERSDLELINKELEMNNLDRLKVGADYIIIGSVSEFGRNTTGKSGVFTRSKKQTAHAKVNIRLVDVYSGQIIYSEEGEGEAYSEVGTVLGIGGKAGYDNTLNDKAISAAISKLVGNIVENLMDKPWRSFILDYTNDMYIISGGKSQGLKNGDRFAVFKKGKKVKNPQTGMMTELPGEQVGKIEVMSLVGDIPANEIAICKKTTGDLPVDNFDGYFIQEIR